MISTALLYVILSVIVITTIVVVALAIIEHGDGKHKNYIGDSSLIPGCLFWAAAILTALIVFGYCTGRILFK